jgi:hypothetical protein
MSGRPEGDCWPQHYQMLTAIFEAKCFQVRGQRLSSHCRPREVKHVDCRLGRKARMKLAHTEFGQRPLNLVRKRFGAGGKLLIIQDQVSESIPEPCHVDVVTWLWLGFVCRVGGAHCLHLPSPVSWA